MTYDDILREVRALPSNLRQQLLIEAAIDDDTFDDLLVPQLPPSQRRKLMEFAGVGAHLYDGMDAQDYVNQMRDEWDNRS